MIGSIVFALYVFFTIYKIIVKTENYATK